METTFIFPSDNTRFKENGSENTLSTDLELTPFKDFLLRKGASDNTIRIYLLAVRHFFSHSDTIDPENHGMNQYLQYMEISSFKLPAVKYQQKTFIDNVISKRNYEILKKKLKKDENWFWYFVVRFLGATGMRVSELLKIKAEHVKLGMMDLYSKGGKMRRIYFPAALCEEAEIWLKRRDIVSGYIFTGRNGQVITARGIRSQLKVLAKRYKIPSKQVYPHSFRHRFAKNFLEKFNDISLLADLMGHESIETTRIYLTRSSEEQQKLIDRVVKW